VAENHKIYLDQMLQLQVAETLRLEGHDVKRASETGQYRADDAQILERAVAENRILITLDEHFGDWVVLPLKEHSGVVRIRANPATSKAVTEILVPLLRRYSAAQFKNRLVILSSNRSKWIDTA
jgi:predicted nuclease of predicted toxin-antitoxin system